MSEKLEQVTARRIGRRSPKSYPPLKDTPNWPKMTETQRHFLAAYPMFHSLSDTSSYIGKEQSWGTEQARDPLFGTALNHMEWVLLQHGVYYYEKEWLVKQAAKVINAARGGDDVRPAALKAAQ